MHEGRNCAAARREVNRDAVLFGCGRWLGLRLRCGKQDRQQEHRRHVSVIVELCSPDATKMDGQLVNVIYQLLPGFLAAWIFYGLTAFPRRDLFERVVQALIFTGMIQVGTNCFGAVLRFAGKLVSFGTWTDRVAFGWSMAFAVAFGVIISTLANRDTVHRWLREGSWIKKLRVTSKHSFPSEWFSAFQRDKRFVVLHLKDGRRLYGWPDEWPNETDGHFLITCPAWILDDGTDVPLAQVYRIIIDVKLVEWVEQLTEIAEREIEPSEISNLQAPLLALHIEKAKEKVIADNGKEHS